MHSLVNGFVAAALLAASVAAAGAQEARRGELGFNPYAAALRAPICTREELRAGLTGVECGKLSLRQLAELEASRDSSN